MVLGKLPVPGCPAGLDSGGARNYYACNGCLDAFTLFFLPLWKTARYRLKYSFKGQLDPKQPTKCFLFSCFSYNTKIRNAGVFKAKNA